MILAAIEFVEPSRLPTWNLGRIAKAGGGAGSQQAGGDDDATKTSCFDHTSTPLFRSTLSLVAAARFATRMVCQTSRQ